MKELAAKKIKLLALLLCCITALWSHGQLSADFSLSIASGCSPLSIQFTNTSSGTSSTTVYSWSFGNGNTSVLQNPSAIFIDEKTYTVTLLATDGVHSSTKTKTLTVYKKPVIDFNATKGKVCLPEGVQFMSSSLAGSGSITNYQWDFGDGQTSAGFGSTAFHNYTNAMVPAVSLTVTNSFGCQASLTKTNEVEVLPKIEPLFTVNKTMLCHLDDSIVFTNNSTGPGPLQYMWDFGDGTTSTAQTPSHKYLQKAVYAVRLTITNAVGCSVTSLPVSINAAYFATNFSTQQLCRQVGFSGSSFITPSFSQWSFGDASSSTSYPFVSHTYPSAGTFEATLTNTYGTCKDTIKKPVIVHDAGSFNTTLVAPATACKNNTVNFTSNSLVPPISSAWNFGDGSQNTFYATTAYHTYTQPGTYTVTVTNTFGTCTETVSKTITVNDLPAINGFVIDFGGKCGAPVTVSLRDTSATAVTWKWWMDWNFGTPFSTAQNASYSFSSNGFHTAFLTVTNAAGCTASVSKPVDVVAPSATIRYSYSSSPKGYYDCDSLSLHFFVNSNLPIQSYSWNLGNGQTSTSPTPQAHYNQPGIYQVVLNYITESGCAGTATFSPQVYDKPQADFTYNVPCGNSLSLSFANTASFSDYEFWNFGDGGQAPWMYPTHAYADTGWYNVTLISRIGHCADTITKPVYAHLLPSSISITKAQNSCEGTRGTVTFDQRSVRCSGGTWDFGDGTVIPYDSSNHFITHTYTATGTYVVKLTSNYKACTYTATQTVSVLLKQAPLLTGTVSQLCTNSSVAVTISNLELNPFAQNSIWNDHYYINKFQYGNVTTFSGAISTHNFQVNNYAGTLQNFAAGTTSIRAIINDNYTGCQDTSNFINLLINGPIAGFKISNNNGCYKSPFVFVDTSRSATAVALTSWRWELGDGTIITNTTNAQVTHRYTNPGNYFVRLTVTDASGCSKTVTATALVRGPKAAFTTSGLYIPNVPLNTTVNFFNNSSATGAVTYTWHYGNGITSGNFNGSYTYTVPGTYTVMLIATEAAVSCADTAVQTITVKDFNTAFTFTKSFIGGGSCPPVLVRITNLSVGYTRVLWDFGDGITSTQSFPSHTYHHAGVYRITLNTYGFNGLTGTYTDSIEVKKPSAQLTADNLYGCTSKQIALQANTQNADSYVWDFGDGSSATTAAVLPHSYLTAGIYRPQLIIKDDAGCAASAQLSDSIIIDSLSIAIKGIPPTVCDSMLIQFAPDVQSFAASRLNTILHYKWDFGTGSAADTSNIKNPSFRYTSPGTYIVTFTVTSPYGCVRQTIATIVVHQKAKAGITATAESCEQSAVQFIGAATPSAGVQWTWNFGNSSASTQQNPSHAYAAAGTYTVLLVVIKNGCTDTAMHQLLIHPKPVVNAAPKEKTLCLGDSVTLSANGGGSYEWAPAYSLNNNSIATPVAKPLASTWYNVKVISDKGCTNYDSVSITVAQPVHVSISGDKDICFGESTHLIANGAYSYQWINTTTGLNNTTINNPSASPIVSTTYSVIGSDNYNCFKDTAAIIVTVHNLPTVSAGPDIQVQGGLPHQLTSVASSDVINWLWMPATALSCTQCASPIVTPKMETTYSVKVTNNWGCVANDTILVRLHCISGNIYIPDAFTPNNDGRNDVFYISGSGVKIIRYLRIYDRWGGVMFEKTAFGIDDASSAWDGKVNGRIVASGSYVYIAEMECSSGEKFVRKGTVTVIR